MVICGILIPLCHTDEEENPHIRLSRQYGPRPLKCLSYALLPSRFSIVVRNSGYKQSVHNYNKTT